MLLLLIGVPSQRRRRIGVALGASLLVMTVVGLVFEFTAARPQVVEGALIEIGADGAVKGVAVDYQMTVDERFQLRDAAAARANNANVDTWIVDNRHDAHITTACYDTTLIADEAQFVAGVVSEMTAQQRVLVERTAPAGVGLRRVARLESRGELAFLVDINVQDTDHRLCVVYAFAPVAGFDTRRAALTAALDSFRFTP